MYDAAFDSKKADGLDHLIRLRPAAHGNLAQDAVAKFLPAYGVCHRSLDHTKTDGVGALGGAGDCL